MEWFVIQTKPKKEEEAKFYLSTKGLEIFSPLMEDFVIINGIINKQFKPLFPSYIFGKFELDKDYPLSACPKMLRGKRFWQPSGAIIGQQPP